MSVESISQEFKKIGGRYHRLAMQSTLQKWDFEKKNPANNIQAFMAEVDSEYQKIK